MTEAPVPEKVDPETLVLRAKPRPAIRIKRNVLIAAAAIGCVAVAGLTWIGLAPPVSHTPGPATRDTDPEKARPNLPDQATAWKATYADVPQLGPPLPGDLGRPILEHQRSMADVQGGTPVPRGTGSDATMPKPATLFFSLQTAASSVPVSQGSPVAQRGVEVNGAAEASAPLETVRSLEALSQDSDVNPHGVRLPGSTQTVMAGTVISAALVTGLNSDLPGLVLAQVTTDVRDSVTGTRTLIPRGARLIGKYDSTISFGQSRVLVVWQRIIWPDGHSLTLDNMPAADMGGFTGLSDSVDLHTATLLKGIGLSTLLGITGELGGDSDDDLVEALRQSTRATANQAGQKIVSRDLDVQPTLTVRPGWPLRVIVQKDLDLSALNVEEGL